jgi:predicted Zn-dependent peptidase
MDQYTLPNGVRVVLVPMSGVESIAVGVYVGTGSRYETATNNGVSHFIEHMAFKGTQKFPTTKDVSYLEGLGAMQNAVTGLDYTAYYCKIPADKWQEGLEVVKELALHPLFPESETEVERGVILEELKWSNDRPDELIGDVMQEALYPNHPLGQNILGTEQTLKSLSRPDFVDYHQTHYTSANLVVAVSGRLNEIAHIKTAIESWFGQLPKSQPVMPVPFVETQKSPQAKFMAKPSLQQAFVGIAVKGITNDDPRRFAMGVLNSYLGRGFTSRFHQEIREKRGLCYSIHSGDNRLQDTGYWVVFAGLNKDKLPEAIEAILLEMKRVRDQSISEEKLIESKEKIRGPLIFSMENPIHQMDFYAKQVLDKPHDVLSYDAVIDRVMHVTSHQVQSLADDLFQTRKLNLAIVGPVSAKEKSALPKLLEI